MRKTPVPTVFTRDQAAKLCGVSAGQLARWDRTDFYPAGLGGFYSFRDIVALRTIGELRNGRRFSLQALRRLGKHLRAVEGAEDPWASMRFATAGREILYYDKHERLMSGTKLRQRAGAVPFPLDKVRAEMEREARKLNERQSDEIGKVIQTRGVLGSSWRLAGTRIPTALVWQLREAGCTVRDILERYPRLTKRDVQAAIEHEEKLRAA
jgi:uncharacterized protein (DUF433 family)